MLAPRFIPYATSIHQDGTSSAVSSIPRWVSDCFQHKPSWCWVLLSQTRDQSPEQVLLLWEPVSRHVVPPKEKMLMSSKVHPVFPDTRVRPTNQMFVAAHPRRPNFVYCVRLKKKNPSFIVNFGGNSTTAGKTQSNRKLHIQYKPIHFFLMMG